MFEDYLIKTIQKAGNLKEVKLEYPEDERFGDYTTNIALKQDNPRAFAEKLVEKLEKDKELEGIFTKMEIAGPGFINFYLKKDYLLRNLSDSLKEGYLKGNTNKGKTIMVEFAHPNTHKLFHIGHLRNITTGEAVCRLLESTGAKVVRVNYQGDVGLHIAKALYGIQSLGFKDPGEIDERVAFLGKAYSAGHKAYEEDKKAKEEIEKINKKIYDKSDKELYKVYQTTRKWSLEYFDKIYQRVNTKFDRFYFESETYANGLVIAEKALKDKILVRSEGAVIFPGEKCSLHNRVFVTSKGVPTYEAKDLGLGRLQFDEYKPDKIIHVVSSEQSGYFQVVFKALEEIFPETKGKEKHLVYGWVSLKEGKMSSRSGNVVLGEWLLDEAKKEIIKAFKTEEETAEKIGTGAVKYSFLKVGTTQEISFDLKESVSLEGNSAPYIQYTFARTNSLLAKANSVRNENKAELNEEELSVLRYLVRFPGVVAQAAESFAPNMVANYLFELSQKFNNFYNQHKIIGGENEVLRLKMTKSVGKILKEGLNLLGIEAPEKM
jgi:arginyl-tRNA synthetase